MKELKDAKERIGMLEDVLDHREHTIKSLQYKLGQSQPEGDDPSAANSITTKQVASLSKIKSKIQSNSPQRCRPTQPSHKVHDSEEFLQASRNASSAVLDHHAAQDELKDQSIKEFKQLNLVPPPTEKKRGGSPNESEPDIITLRKRLERTDVSREALQQQCLEAMEKAARCSITHQQSLHHLQQISEMHPENHTIPTNSAECMCRKNTSGALDWRSYNNDPLERENRALQAREKFRSMVFWKQ